MVEADDARVREKFLAVVASVPSAPPSTEVWGDEDEKLVVGVGVEARKAELLIVDLAYTLTVDFAERSHSEGKEILYNVKIDEKNQFLQTMKAC